jgi:hypothetical protein
MLAAAVAAAALVGAVALADVTGLAPSGAGGAAGTGPSTRAQAGASGPATDSTMSPAPADLADPGVPATPSAGAGATPLVALARQCRATTAPPAEEPAPAASLEPVPASLAAGRALLANPAVRPCPGAGAALASGAVDGRLLALLALTADRWSYRFATIGVDDGPAAATAVLTDLVELPGHAAPGADVPAVTAVSWFEAQRPPFRPAVVAAVDARTVVVSFEPGAASLVP